MHSHAQTSVIYQHEVENHAVMSRHSEIRDFDPKFASLARVSGADGLRPLHLVETETALTAPDSEDTFPEGGFRAWLVVVGAFLMLFPTYGLLCAIGTLQAYWLQNQLSTYSARDVGWIPSVFGYLMTALGLWVGPISDQYGPRYMIFAGSMLYIIMLFLLAECSVYWQILLCCGVLGGVGGAMLTTISLAVVSHWFKARRGFAQGVTMMGTSLGSLVIPLILSVTLPKYGYEWSIRILAFVFTTCIVVGNVLLRARIPPDHKTGKAILSLAKFKDARFCFLTASIFGLETVIFGALGILPTYTALKTDFPSGTGFHLIAILSGCSFLGRVLPGYAADSIGRINVLIVMVIFSLISMLAVWLPFGAHSLAALYLFAALFGFGSGSWTALFPACLGQLCRADEFGAYFGSSYFVAGLAILVCVPISGELVEIAGPQVVVLFSCAVLALSLLALILSRWACLSWKWTWRVKI